MRRRTCLKSLAGVPATAMAKPSPGGNSFEAEVIRLKLRHTWTTTMSSSEYRDNIYFRFTSEGVTGMGEGAPIVRYKETAELARKAIESIGPLLKSADPWKFSELVDSAFAPIQGHYTAKAAVDIALMDWVGQKLGIPLYRYLGLDAAKAPVTTFSIGIADPAETKKKVLEAEPFPVLKIKVGLDRDEATLEAVRSVTKKPLRLDANEGFKTKEEAVRKINWLESLGAEFIEQPLPARMHEEAKWVRSRVHIPVLADEACVHLEDIPKIADAYDGIVIKLDKSGGILKALQMIHAARAHKLRVMLGCMISSSVSITAAAHLSPLVDYADLDGNLLIANDPYSGVKVVNGKLVLPDRPGLGLTES